MPENQQSPPIEQQVIIRITEVIDDARKSIGHLKELNKLVQTASKSISRLERDYRRYGKAATAAGKQVAQSAKHQRKLIEVQKKQRSALKITTKDTEKLRRLRERAAKQEVNAQKRIQRAVAKTRREVTRSMKNMRGASGGGGGRGGGGSGRRGFGGIGLPAFLSVTAITAAATALGKYMTQLARTRDMAAAVTGGRRMGLNQRDSELVTGFATQRFSNRFLGQTELKGLTAIRDRLQQALGDEAGSQLTLKLTEGFKSSAEQAEFLATASQDVVKALQQFQSVDNIDDFSTALSAATQQTDALSRTAYTLEQAWRDVRDSFEKYVTDFVQANEIDLKQSIQTVVKSVVDLINWGRRWAAEWKPVFKFILDGFRVVGDALDYWQDPFRGGRKAGLLEDATSQMEIYNRAAAKYIELAKQAKARGDETLARNFSQQAQAATDKAQDIFNSALDDANVGGFELITLGTAENVEKVKLDTEATVKAAQRERKEFEATRSTVEKTALALERLDESSKIGGLELDLIRSRIQRYQNSPFGFGKVYEEQIRAAKQIDHLLDLNREKQAAVSKLNQNLVENRERLLKLQVEENDLLSERNQLLQASARGYLDAIQAQAFGAGRFQKIILEQDSNIAMALRKNVAKANPLLGLVGDAAAKNKVDSFRFSGDPKKDDEQLARYHEQLRTMFSDWLKDLKGILVPPAPQQAVSIAAGQAMAGPSAQSPTNKATSAASKAMKVSPSVASSVTDLNGYDLRTSSEILRDRNAERRRIAKGGANAPAANPRALPSFAPTGAVARAATANNRDSVIEQQKERVKHAENGIKIEKRMLELMLLANQDEHEPVGHLSRATTGINVALGTK